MTDKDPLTHEIIGAAMAVSKTLKVGLFESIYEKCLYHELTKRGFSVNRQVGFPVIYDGVNMGLAFRADLIVEQSVVIEVKTVQAFLPIHDAQLINYMRLANIRIGLLLNFHAIPFVTGIRRRIL